MSKKQVKISIAGRNYPLTIDAHEENGVLEAEKLIQENINKLKTIYNINNPQDLLAMTALEFATKLHHQNGQTISNTDFKTIDDLATLLKSL